MLKVFSGRQIVFELRSSVIKSPFTRLPLWRGETDNIIGVLHSKDVLRAVKRAELDGGVVDIKRIISEPRFVPETTTLREQLNHFLAWRTHLALVVDEYGALMGAVRSLIFPVR